MIKGKADWLFALVLALPMLVFFLAYLFNHDASLEPTGFIQYDNVSYLAYAHQYLDNGHSGIFYNNPFNSGPGYQGIYFQPQTLLFAALLKIGIPAGSILIAFTILCTILCFRLLIAIHDTLFPQNKYRTVSIWVLAWGGGLLALSGIMLKLFHPSINDIFYLDPGSGWWGLNFGRALFFSCEAYYHLLFLCAIYFVLVKKWFAVILVSLLLSISHPFTGIELLAIICSWCIVEIVIAKNKAIPVWFVLVMLGVTAFHIYYYLFYLGSFPEHQSVNEQYQLNWRLRYFHMIPAYIITGGLALYTIFRIYTPKTFLGKTSNRLFMCWFAVAFLLANHELFIRPMQPLHFTRGYIWTALMLMGLPAIHYLLERRNRNNYAKVLALGILILLFTDNLFWIGNQVSSKARQPSTAHITAEQKSVLTEISKNSTTHTLLISLDPVLPYLSTVYSPAYPWYSHPYTTPFAERKKNAVVAFIENGSIDPQWQNREILFLFRKDNEQEARRAETLKGKLILESEHYILISFTT